MKPTEEQIKKFWEKIADRVESFNEGRHYHFWFGGEVYEGEPTSFASGIPIIDLNNLFKYAVPKIATLDYYIELYHDKPTFVASIYRRDGEYETVVRNEDPALALFWAIWKVIDEN